MTRRIKEDYSLPEQKRMSLQREGKEPLTLEILTQRIETAVATKKSEDAVIGDTLHALIDYYNTPEGANDIDRSPHKGKSATEVAQLVMNSVYTTVREEIRANADTKS